MNGRFADLDIIRPLGKGGMGEVYEARTPEGEHVALKVFTNTGEHADFLRKRFWPKDVFFRVLRIRGS